MIGPGLLIILLSKDATVLCVKARGLHEHEPTAPLVSVRVTNTLNSCQRTG